MLNRNSVRYRQVRRFFYTVVTGIIVSLVAGYVLFLIKDPPKKTASVPIESLGSPTGAIKGWSKNLTRFGLENSNICRTDSDCFKIEYAGRNEPDGHISWIWWPKDCGDGRFKESWEKFESGACGIDMKESTGWKKIKEISFYARGEQGGEQVKFQIGGAKKRPDVSTRSIFENLSSEWKEYRIALSDLPLSKVTTLFQFTVEYAKNPEGAVFYLDDIRFLGK